MVAPRLTVRRFTTAYSPNEVCLVFWDASVVKSTQRRVVVLVHGYNQIPDGYNPQTSLGYRYEVVKLVEAGYVVVVPNAGGVSTWGNDTSQTAVGAAVSFVQDTTSTGLGSRCGVGVKTDSVVLMGVSMGCFTTLNWGRANATKVKAYVCVLPALALASIHDGNRLGLATIIETAYGGSSAYTAAATTHDPNQNKTNTAYTGKPGYMIYNTTDTVVLPADVTTFLSGGPSWATATVSTPTGHDDSNADYAALVTWITANAA